jgi:multiple sugar transport system substrate-binding protein
MRFWHDLIFRHRVSPSPETVASGLGMAEPDLFKAGRLVFFLAGIWMTPEFQKIKDFDWDVAMFPRGPSGERRSVAEGSGYSITRKCKHPEEAWRFVKFVGGEPGQTILSRPALAQPAIMKLADSELFLTSERPRNKRIVVEGAKHGVYRPFTHRWSEVQQNYLNPQINLIMSPDEKVRIPLEEGLREVVERINRDIFGRQ